MKDGENLTIGDILIKAYSILKEKNIETYMLDAQLLLCKVLKKDKMFLFMNRNIEVDDDLYEQFFKYIEMRKNRMPVKYILKECEFMGINFYINEGVLIPRPDTEILVEKAIDVIKANNYKSVCYLCCGSGIIGISIAKLLSELNLSVVCSDISSFAQEVTQKNIGRLNLNDKVKFIKSNLLNFAYNQNYKFDIIVSNPPYIEEDVIPTLSEDVKEYEPIIALSGGKDGLDFYRNICIQASKVINKNGMLCFEIGYNQKESVKTIMENNHFKDVECIKDLAGFDRVLVGKYGL